jgi:hypothetical protein
MKKKGVGDRNKNVFFGIVIFRFFYYVIRNSKDRGANKLIIIICNYLGKETKNNSL